MSAKSFAIPGSFILTDIMLNELLGSLEKLKTLEFNVLIPISMSFCLLKLDSLSPDVKS